MADIKPDTDSVLEYLTRLREVSDKGGSRAVFTLGVVHGIVERVIEQHVGECAGGCEQCARLTRIVSLFAAFNLTDLAD